MQKMSHNCGYLSTPDVWAVIPQWLEKELGASSFTAGPILIHTDSGEGVDIVFSYAHTKGPNQWQVASSEAQHLGI